MPRGYTFDSNHGPGVSGSFSSSGSGSSGSGSSGSGSSRSYSVPSEPIGYDPPETFKNGTNGVYVGYDPSQMIDMMSGAMYNSASEYGQAIRDQMGMYTSSAERQMDEYIDMARDIANANNNLSQQQAREMMAFQEKSDRTAMSWSAQQAQINREFQERLSNTAHQREVQDLIKAGLNPILSANAGASTASGATGQGFSSNGAMGNVDNSLNGLLGQLISTSVNTASQAQIARMYTDAQRYQSDMAYAQAKLASETSILNNDNSISAQKAIHMMNNDAELKRANISANATMSAAGSSAAAMMNAAQTNAEATKFAAQTSADASKYRADIDYQMFSEDPKRTPEGAVEGYDYVAETFGLPTTEDIKEALSSKKEKGGWSYPTKDKDINDLNRLRNEISK